VWSNTQGRCHEFEGGGINAFQGGGEGQYSKNTKIRKRWGVHDSPNSYGGAAPANTDRIVVTFNVDDDELRPHFTQKTNTIYVTVT